MEKSPDYLARQNKLRDLIARSQFAAIALNPGASFFYFTGLHFHLMERPTVVIFPAGQAPVIILPELEAAKVSKLNYPINPFYYGEDPDQWAAIFKNALSSLDLDGKKIGIEPTKIRFLELDLITNNFQDAQCVPADTIIADLRACKDSDEVNNIKQAVQIAQIALTKTLPLLRVGMTEREIAAELTIQLLHAGCEPELPFSPIVSSGPNSANPHAAPSDRPLAYGDLLLFDWGASYQGYFSDLTRTFAIGDVDPEFKNIHSIVMKANQEARLKIRPGVTASEIDAAARRLISANNYGDFFFHRTGHGIGLEAHEEPYIRSGSNQILKKGMVFTVEPGIYLPGKGGVRIEDNVVVSKDGVETLSDLPRDLVQLG